MMRGNEKISHDSASLSVAPPGEGLLHEGRRRVI
jgi:hypothetical protein